VKKVLEENIRLLEEQKSWLYISYQECKAIGVKKNNFGKI